MLRTCLALLYRNQKFGTRGLGSRINIFVLFLPCYKGVFETKEKVCHIFLVLSLCSLLSVESNISPALCFQTVPKGTVSSSTPFYLCHGQGQPFKPLAKLFLKVTKDLHSLLKFHLWVSNFLRCGKKIKNWVYRIISSAKEIFWVVFQFFSIKTISKVSFHLNEAFIFKWCA